ncbi:hypothetical protein DFJ74DRAFT_712393 [Hyaloraphidium curvatum]|nr:hypothetical protein DFJ74DRAFT_712393 [Hyaloraphidium curvatum]
MPPRTNPRVNNKRKQVEDDDDDTSSVVSSMSSATTASTASTASAASSASSSDPVRVSIKRRAPVKGPSPLSQTVTTADDAEDESEDGSVEEEEAPEAPQPSTPRATPPKSSSRGRTSPFPRIVPTQKIQSLTPRVSIQDRVFADDEASVVFDEEDDTAGSEAPTEASVKPTIAYVLVATDVKQSPPVGAALGVYEDLDQAFLELLNSAFEHRSNLPPEARYLKLTISAIVSGEDFRYTSATAAFQRNAAVRLSMKDTPARVWARFIALPDNAAARLRFKDAFGGF